MPNENYIIDILRNLYPSLKMDLRQENFNEDDVAKRKLCGRILLPMESETLELELEVYFSRIYLTSIRPYKGIVSCGPFIPLFANPLHNGYMDSEGNLTQKGSYYIFKMLRDILNMVWLARDRANAILELYAIYYFKMLEKDSFVEFGKIRLNSGSAVTQSLSEVVKKRFGFTIEWSVDMFHSFQNIVVNHPEIFNGELN